MVKGIVNGTTTYYPGKHYNKEITNNIPKVQKFYIAGTMTIAVRTDGVLQWILPDHLGSTSTSANADGTLNSVIQYTAFGEIRSTQGITPTKYRYTGQLAQAELGLDYYVSRWYDPVLGHFTQADTLIPEPGKASAFDRYAYVRNNPLRYNDPSGHDVGCPGRDASECYQNNKPWSNVVEFVGGNDKQRNAIKSAIYTIGSNFQKYLTLTNQSDVQAFNRVYGKIISSFSGSGGICEANSTGFNCGESASSDPKLYAHELGHTMNAIIVNKYKDSSIGPYADLNKIALIDIEGRINALGALSPYRNELYPDEKSIIGAGYYRTIYGYKSGGPPNMYHGPDFGRDWNSNGIALMEDSADMFMNWTFKNFADNYAGIQRYKWIDEYLSIWIAEATR